MLKKYIYILLPVLCSLFFSFESKGQCVDSIFTNSTCITPNNNITFQTNNTLGAWWIYDATGNLMFSHIPGSWGSPPLPTNIINYTFPLEGIYSVEFSDGGWPSCNYTLDITVVSNPVNIQSLNTITLCEGTMIDTSDINLEIFNSSNNLSFSWVTQPNSYPYTGITTNIIPITESSITLTVIDNITGCLDNSIITLNYISTSIQNPTILTTPDTACAGTPIEVIVMNSNTSLYNYTWNIQNDTLTGDSIITTLEPTLSSSAPIVLNITEISNGCEISFFDTITIAATPIITLDTNYATWDIDMQGFKLCAGVPTNNSNITNIDLLFNATLSNIDSMVVNFGDGNTTTLSQPYNLLNHNYNNTNNYVLTLNPYYNGCSFPTTYNILGGSTLDTINGGGLQYLASTACIDSSTWFYLNDQNNNPITNIGPNDQIIWTIYCDYPSDPIEFVWGQSDLVSNLFDLPNNSFPFQIPVFQYSFPDNSCGCTPPIPGNQQYYVTAELIKYCSVNDIGFATFVTIEEPVEPNFSIPPDLCEGQSYQFQNNAQSGCDGESVSGYSDSIYFSWNFGDCTIRDTSTASYPFPDIWHTYDLPGIYNIALTAVSYCGSVEFDTIVPVYPLPNVSFSTNNVCLDDTNYFNSITSFETQTTRIDICNNGDTNIIQVPAGSPVQSYQWSMGISDGSYVGGTTDSVPDPQFIFNSPGIKTITLTVDDGRCTNSYSFTFQVYELPIPYFSSEVVCAGDCTPINDLSISTDHPIENWDWNLGDGTNYTLNYSNDTCYTYNQACTNPNNSEIYDIYLQVTDTFGCTYDTTILTTVLCQPQANFDTIGACQGSIMQLINTSSPINSDFKWVIDPSFGYFINNTTADSTNPQFLFDTCGVLPVTLILINNNCPDTITKYIIINCLPDITQFNTSVQGVCQEDDLLFSSLYNEGDTAVNYWQWNFGDGNTSFSSNDTVFHAFDTCSVSEIYTAEYIISDLNGCSDTATTTFNVFCLPEIQLTGDGENVCLGGVSAFGSNNNLPYNSNNYSFNWNWGDGSDITYYFDSILVHHEYLDSGSYIATLAITDLSNGCSDTGITNVRIHPNPTAEITSLNTCLGDSTLFEVNYIAGDSIITEWNWDFGNNNPVTISDTNFYHYFNNCGDTIYIDLELIGSIVDDNGITCHGEVQDTLMIYCLPEATLFPVPDSCAGTYSVLSFDSLNTTNPIDNISWDFGGVIINSDSSTFVLYDNCGDYNITLTLEDTAGCKMQDSTIATVLCNTVPEFTLTPDSVTCGDDTIIATAIDISLEYTWIIQPYTTTGVNAFNPVDTNGVSQSHIFELFFYQNSGPNTTLYNIYLTEENNFCSDTTSQNISVFPLPIIAFEVDTTFGCDSLELITINNSETNNIGENITSMSFSWYLNNLFQTNGLNYFDTFINTSGDSTCYDIKLVGESQNLCKDSTNLTVCVNPTPIAKILYQDSCFCPGFNLTDLNITALDTSLNDSIHWYIYDQSWVLLNDTAGPHAPSLDLVNQNTTTHIILTAYNFCGFTNDTINICTWDKPDITQFNTSFQGICQDEDMLFFSDYIEGDTAVNYWQWNFGDGNTSFSSNDTVFHAFDTCSVSEIYTAEYIISDLNGCSDTATTTFNVFCLPEIQLTGDGENVCLGGVSAFGSNNNLPYNSNNYSFNWNWGDGSDITYYFDSILVHHEYLDSGSYIATLAITDLSNGCSDTGITNVRIHPNPTAEITSLNTCLGDSTLFEVNYIAGDSIITEWNWDFGNNNPVTISDTNFYHYFNNCGDTIYIDLELIGSIVDDNGITCHGEVQDTLMIYCLPDITLLPVSDTCEGINSIITFDTTGGTNTIEFFSWDFGGLINNSDSATYILYQDCGDYEVTVQIEDSAGCSASDTIDITVLCNTIPEFTLTPDSLTCGDETIIAIAIDTTLEYTWSTQPYDPAFVNSFNPANSNGVSQFYMWENIFTSNPGPDSTLYTISAFEVDNVCSDTIEHTITVYPTPLINFVIDTFSCSPLILNTPNNYSDPNNGSETINSMTFEWYLNTTLQNDTLHLIDTLLNTNIDDTTCYDIVIIGTTQHGCINSSSNEICIKPDPIAEINFSDTCLCAPFDISSLNITGNYYDINDSTYWQVFDSSGNLIDSSSGLIPPIVTVQNASDFITMVFYAINSCDTVSDTLTICSFEDPVSMFSLGGINQGNSPLTVFADTTGLGVTQGATYIWTVSDINGTILETYTTYVDSFTLTNTSPTLDSIYVISLQVINSNGCDSTSSDTVTINPSPSSGFILSADSICPDDIITVIDTSNANPSITYLWTVSPNAFITDSTADSTTITFPNNVSGNTIMYTITLYITDSVSGFTDSDSQYVYVNTNPIALFNITPDACGPDTLTPTNNSSFQDSCLWSVNSSTVGISNDTACNPEFYFPENTGIIDSTYIITLTVTTEFGCDSTITDTVIIHPTPWVEINPTLLDSCGPFIIDFTNGSNAYNSDTITVMDFYWWVDGTLQDSTINFTETFNNGFNVIEEYVVTLIGTTQYGCTSSDTDTVTVYPDPIAIIDTNGNILDCATLVIDSTLIQADTLNTIANHNYEWIITHYNPSSIVTGNGYYPPLDSITSDNDSVQVILTVSNDWGCNPAADTIMIYTIEDPIADFIVSDSTGCSPLSVQTDTTINSTNGIYTWEVWNLDTDNIDTTIITTGISNPIITLNNYSNLVDSIYVIQLTVGDTNGCSHTTQDTVIVHPKPVAYFTTNTNAICPDEIITVNDSSTTSIGLNYTWTIEPNNADIDDDNADTTTITFPNNTIGYDSIYNITLNIIDTNGCVDSYIDSIAIHTNPIALFNITPDACGPDTLTPTNNSSFQDSCLWSVNSSTVGISNDTACNPEFYFPENTGIIDSTYIITLTVTTEFGCDSTITDTVIIHPTPWVEINPTLLDSCGPFIIDFTNGSNAYNSDTITVMDFYWWVDGTLQDSTINFTETFNNGFNVIEEYVVTLIGTTQYGCTSSDTDTVTVYPDPIAIIDTNGNILDCATLVIDSTLIQADTLNTIANHNYEWIITHYNPSSIVTGNGYYPPLDSITSDNDSVQVILTVSNDWGCNPAADTIMIYTIEDPIADFIVSDSTGCSPLSVQTDTTINSTNGIYTWEVWNLDTDNIDTTIITTGISNPIITLNNYSNLVDSIYVIQLTVGDTNGCSHTTQDTVIVHPKPVAYFTTNTNAICPDEIITVNDSSTTSIGLNYTWTIEPNNADIDDDNADTTTITFPNNTIGYDSIYNITLNIIDTNGCVDSYIDSIAIHTNPIALFNITPDACGPDTLTPTNNSSFQDSCLWSVNSSTVGISNDTACNPEFYFPENTGIIDSTYIITLTVTTEFGCDSTITDTVIIHPTPWVEINPTLLDSCGPFIIDFTNGSNAYNSDTITVMDFYWWVDGTLQDSTINFTETFNNGFNVIEEYVVTLIGTTQYGCTSSDTDTVTVYPDPIAIIDTNGNILDCATLVIDSTLIQADTLNTIANHNYEWIITHYNPSSIVTGNGYYPPLDSITSDNDSVQVILTVSNDWGCNPAADTIMIYTIEDPIADFIVSDSTGCSPLSVQTDTTINSTNGIYTWEVWNLDTDNIDTTIITTGISNPIITLNNYSNLVDSIYVIQLTVGDTNGCSHTTQDTVIVHPKPVAYFTTNTNAICPDEIITVNDSSTTSIGLNYTWTIEPNNADIDDDNADTTTITFPNNTIGYDSIYNITLNIIDTNGCVDSYIDSIAIHTNPIALFNITPDACGPDTLTPTNNSSFQDSCLWSVNSSTVGISNDTACNPEFYFPENTGIIDSTYIITLTVTTEFGCDSTITDTVIIHPTPWVEINPTLLDSCGPFIIDFTNGSNAYNSDTITVMDFYWWVDGTLQDSTINFTETFNNGFNVIEEYVVTLIGTTQYGCTSSDTDTVTVYPDPIAIIDTNGNILDCATLVIDSTLIQADTLNTIANHNYEWIITHYNPSSIVTGNGYYPPLDSITSDNDSVQVILTVSNDWGCNPAADTIMIYTIEDPIADFIVSDSTGCSPLSVQTDTTINSTNGIYTWEVWNLDTDNIDTTIITTGISNPIITLNNYSNLVDSIYVIQLTVGDTNGCSHTTQDTVIVHPKPVAYFTTNTNAICPDEIITVNDSSTTSIGLNYTWTIEPNNADIDDDNADTTTITFPNNTIGYDSIYNITLNIIDTNGCVDSYIDSIAIHTNPIALFNITPDACGPDTLTPTNNSSFQDSCLWSVNSSTVGISNDTACNPEFYFPENTGIIDSTYIITLTVTTEFGCDSTITDTVIIHPTPWVEINPTLLDSCGPFIIDFTNGSNAYNSDTITVMDFYWWVDGTLQDSTINFTETFNNGFNVIEEYVVTLIGTTQYGCTSSDTDTVTVYPDPIAIIDTNGNILDCATLVIDSTLIQADTLNTIANHNYEWIITHYNPSSIVTGNGYYPPLDSITSDNDSVQVILTVSNDWGCNPAADTIMIYTIEDPIADFIVSDSTGCSPLSVQTDTTINSTNGIYTWEVWNLDTDNIDTTIITTGISNPIITLNNYSNLVDSIYVIQLTVGDTNGCSHTTQDTVIVHPKPVAYFTTENVCDSIEAIFIDNSDSTNVPITNWQWNFGDTLVLNDTSILKNPLPYIYTTWGQWNVNLIITDQNGCKETADTLITVYPNPSIDFDSSYSCLPDSVCANEIIIFNDASSIETLGGILSNQYWYVNGAFADSTNYNMPFDTSFGAGLYSINYILASEFGCKDSISNTIQVVDIPIASFTLIGDTFCVTAHTQYVDSNSLIGSGYILEYYWTITNTNQDTIWSEILDTNLLPSFPVLADSIEYQKYYISLTVSNCCGDSTYTDSIVIIPLPSIAFYTEPIDCGPNAELPIGTPLELFWDGAPFNNPEHTDYITIYWGDNTDTTLYPYPNPLNIAEWFANVNHIYPDTGTYTICAVGYNSCGTDTMCCNIEITPTNILSQFEVLDTSLVCEGSCVEFRETSNNYNYSNSIVKWWFDWDGTYPPTQSADISIPFVYDNIVSHCYESAGAYLVLHEITGNSALGSPIDSSFNEFDTVYIYPSPDVQINNCVPICNLDTLIIENNTTINDSIDGMEHLPISIDGYQWYIDGVAANPSIINDNLIFTTTTPGVYEIVLEAWSTLGCMSSDTCQVIVYELPEADFFVVPDTICLGDTTVFRDNSINGYWSINTWIWDFGDSNTDTIINYIDATNSYYLSGDYVVGLTVIDGAGCSDTFEDTIYISPNINAFFTHEIVCEGDATPLNGTGSSSSTDIWRWDFDFDGYIDDSLTGPVVSHTFSNPGWHVVFLETWNILSTDTCRDFTTDSIYVYENPTANFTPTIECFNDTTQFNNLSLDGIDANIMSHSWTFFDTPVDYSTDYGPSYLFNSDDTFIVELTVTDTNLCSDTYIDSNVLVATLPVAILSDRDTCESDLFQLFDESLEGTYPFTSSSWLWTIPTANFVLGTNSTTQDPWVQFNSSGSYQLVSLVVTDLLGCTDSTSAYIDIYQNPIAGFSTGNIQCKNTIISISSESFGIDAPINSWYWDFGPNSSPNTSYLDTPSIIYSSVSGYQLIHLEVIDTNGCFDDLDSLVFINNNPVSSFSWSNNCADELTEFVNLSDSTDNGLDYFNWFFSDGGTSGDGNDTIYHIFDVNSYIGASFTTILVATDNAGCKDTFNSINTGNNIEIHPLPFVNFDAPYICTNDTFGFQFYNNSTLNTIFLDSITNTNWSFDGVYDWYMWDWIPFIPPSSLPIDSHDVSLELVTSFGCSNDTSINVMYRQAPEINFSINYTPSSACGENVDFDFITNSILYWNNFSFIIDDNYDADTILTDTIFSHIFEQPGNWPINIFIENTYCSLDSTYIVSTYPNPTALFTISDTSDCEPLNVIFTDSSYISLPSSYTGAPTSIEHWNWNFDLDSVPIEDNQYPGLITYYSNGDSSDSYIPTLEVITDNGCTDIYNISPTFYTLTSSPSPIAIIDPFIQVLPEDGGNTGRFYLDGRNSTTSSGYKPLSLNDYTFNWFAEGNEVPHIPYTGNYTTWQFPTGDTDYDVILEITDNSNGCVSDTIASLYVSYFKGLQVPNALAPNGNSGEPAYFLPKGKSLKSYRLQIFDTWGDMVWETSAITVPDGKPVYPWKGETLDGKPLPQGTYIWKIYAKFTDGTVWPGINGETTGPIYLIR